MALPIILILRAVQALFTIIELGLSAYGVSQFSQCYSSIGIDYCDSSPGELNFVVFNCIWTILVLAYLILSITILKKFAHGIAALALDAITMIFWFSGFIALAVRVGNSDAYYGNSDVHTPAYDALRAAVAFAAFLWALFVATTVLNALEHFRGGSKTTTSRGPAPVHSGV
ncbi:MAG: hypothetical protein M1825_001875 [Sarcosagium campestre]|nr:MAG: hypothetical protein M1825_001875 [Sarcosagium campestre]